MASKRRIRRNMCSGKKRHKNFVGAIIHARKVGHNVRPYKCDFCGGFHVGHSHKRDYVL